MKQLKKHARTIFMVIFAMIFFYGGSCNLEHIDGYIISDSKTVSISDTLLLEAVITDKIEPNDVIWETIPDNSQTELISPFPNDNADNKYKAAFISQEAGKYEISVRFFYKNTNPKNSDSIIIKVTK